MKSVGPLSAVHQSAGKFVNNNDLAVHNDVVFFFFEGHVGTQALLQKMGPIHI